MRLLWTRTWKNRYRSFSLRSAAGGALSNRLTNNDRAIAKSRSLLLTFVQCGNSSLKLAVDAPRLAPSRLSFENRCKRPGIGCVCVPSRKCRGIWLTRNINTVVEIPKQRKHSKMTKPLANLLGPDSLGAELWTFASDALSRDSNGAGEVLPVV